MAALCVNFRNFTYFIQEGSPLLVNIADVTFEINAKHKFTENLCADYVCLGTVPEFYIEVTPSEIEAERIKTQGENFSDGYLESIAVFRKICDDILKYKQGILFHSSAVEVDGKAYLFTAPSGTGKSTHARLLKNFLKDRMSYINDDKPIIRVIDGECFVYGTPWNGKHRLGSNVKVKLQAICEIRRDKENRIEKISSAEMLGVIFRQTVIPEELQSMDEFIKILNDIIKQAELFRLYCNTDPKAAETSYYGMIKGGKRCQRRT